MVRKVRRCYVNIADDPHEYDKTNTGKRKVWFTDGIPTYCCCLTPAYFIWEKNTKYNNYDGYSGYVRTNAVELIS